jgi:hypothetical protein
MVWQSWNGASGQCKAWFGSAVMVRPVEVRSVGARSGLASRGEAVTVWLGRFCRGRAWPSWNGESGLVLEWHGSPGTAGYGMVCPGLAVKSGRGLERRGMAGLGSHGKARLVEARLVAARFCTAGRPGTVGLDMAGLGVAVLARLVTEGWSR